MTTSTIDAEAAKSNPDRYVIFPAFLFASQRSAVIPVGDTPPGAVVAIAVVVAVDDATLSLLHAAASTRRGTARTNRLRMAGSLGGQGLLWVWCQWRTNRSVTVSSQTAIPPMNCLLYTSDA